MTAYEVGDVSILQMRELSCRVGFKCFAQSYNQYVAKLGLESRSLVFRYSFAPVFHDFFFFVDNTLYLSVGSFRKKDGIFSVEFIKIQRCISQLPSFGTKQQPTEMPDFKMQSLAVCIKTGHPLFTVVYWDIDPFRETLAALCKSVYYNIVKTVLRPPRIFSVE